MSFLFALAYNRDSVTRQAQELRSEKTALEQEAEARSREAANLERRLAEARNAAMVAERKREQILKESYSAQAPAKELAGEADK
jgi:predicted  nucleic acid-binding Zn-ribbon protein